MSRSAPAAHLLLLLVLALASTAHALDRTCTGLGLWPQPASITCGNRNAVELIPGLFSVILPTQAHGLAQADVDKLHSAVQRLQARMWLPVTRHTRGYAEPHLHNATVDPTSIPTLASNVTSILGLVDVKVLQPSYEPSVKTVESLENYTLAVASTGSAVLTASSVWGVLHGLETFAQLVQSTIIGTQTNGEPVLFYYIPGTPIEINDAPAYPWRGLLVDTANHYMSRDVLLQTVDALAANKMNVLHWHIIDSYSFPFQSPGYPHLSKKGAWCESCVYSAEDVLFVNQYAEERGVRVLLELDVPGHGYSFGLAYPNITSPCPQNVPGTDIGHINSVPLNPANNFTYALLDGLLAELTALSSDKYFHLGGDELQLACWNHSEIHDFMHAHGLTTLVEVQAYFERHVIDMLRNNDRHAVVWEETFAQIASVLPKSTVIEIWNDAALLEDALDAGFDTILADGWYLDRQAPLGGDTTTWFWLDTWEQMYESPLLLSQDDKSAHRGRILGGEANMWGEQVSELTFNARVWPRACAVAERLWSPPGLPGETPWQAAQRLAHHRCRMASRDSIPTGPIWSDYCAADLYYTTKFTPPQAPPKPKPTETEVKLTKTQLAIVTLFAMFGGVFLYLIAAALLRNLNESRKFEAMAVRNPPSYGSTAPRSSSSAASEEYRLLDTVKEQDEEDEQHQAAAAAAAATGSKPTPSKPGRLKSLDVFRGLTIVLMVAVDNLGYDFPSIDHAPWDGLHLADIVMPFFDFIVGVSLALSFKKFDLEATRSMRWTAFKKASLRFVKLFLLGVATQGGIQFLQYDLKHVRFMGILQRVAICYYVVALMEIYFPRIDSPDDRPPRGGAWTFVSVASRYRWHWFGGAVLVAMHTAVMYGVDVPGCGRGVLTPECNAASYVDIKVLSVQHMYFPSNGGSFEDAGVTFQRLPECSSCSPGLCWRDDAPSWCHDKPFDPEGSISSLTAIVSTVIGVHYGHTLLHFTEHADRMWSWVPFSVVQLFVGLLLHFTNAIVMNTDLYSISYLLVTGGIAGLALALFYYVIDMRGILTPMQPLLYMGMNAIAMYVFSEGGIIQAFLGCFYWNNKDENLSNILFPTGVYWGDAETGDREHADRSPAVLCWVLAYIGFWCFIAYVMFRRRVFIKI